MGERVFFSVRDSGPVHLGQSANPGLSWCGVKQQFRHVGRPGSREEVTCERCLRQVRQDRPLAWKGR